MSHEKIDRAFAEICVADIAQKGAFSFRAKAGEEIRVLNPKSFPVSAQNTAALETRGMITFYDWDEMARKAVGSYNLPSNVLFDDFNHELTSMNYTIP